MSGLHALFANNRAWAAQHLADDPEFFARLARQQSPRYLWIGCSDSRVPANQIIGLQPGEVFVHRNIANLVVHSDLNCLSVLQYAIEVLKVQDIMVVGHYGCGGVQAVAENRSAGLADNWLRHLDDIAHKHDAWLGTATNQETRSLRLAELNVIEQVANVCRTTMLQRTWDRGCSVEVHGLIYSVKDGLLHQLGLSVKAGLSWRECYAAALECLHRRYSA